MTFLGLPKDRCDELLSLLLANIFTNFRACSRPEDYLARADEIAKESETTEQKVILVGASNLNRASRSFEAPDLIFENHSVPGWTPTADNVKKMSTLVEDKAKGGAAFVFDILGNSAVRFEQYDGTTSLPFKSNGRCHLGGRVVSTPTSIFKKVVENVLPIFKAKGHNACIIIPPLRVTFFRVAAMTQAIAPTSMKKIFQKSYWEAHSAAKRTDQKSCSAWSNQFKSSGCVLRHNWRNNSQCSGKIG